jgi:PucR C-terminal helix-turn-helix domain/GAF domain/GGDEF-like domain
MAMYETSPGLGIDPLAPADERRILYEIIRTVSSTVDLERVLEAVVKLIVEGVKAQSCFVWIVERGGRLVLRAASEQYADAVGVTTLAPGEGFAGWVSEHRQPIFIPSDALADPRARYFPEFEEEKYQSMVSVPLIAKDGDLFGVIGLHSLAPRTLTEDDATFVIHSASLVAGAIENARLYEATRRRVHELERLSEISDRAARATTLAELLPAVAEAACDLLEADQVCVYAVDRGERLVRRAAAPAAGTAPPYLVVAAASELPAAVARGIEPAGAVALPLAVDGETLGHVVALRASFGFDAGELDLLGTIATQTAVGWKKIELIDGLTERNLTKDFFGDLAAGRLEGAEGRARRLGCDLASPRLAVVVLPHEPAARPDGERVAALERFEAEVARELSGSVFDRRDDRSRGLVPVVGEDGSTSVERLRAALGALPLVVGVSNAATGAEGVAAALAEARQAARAAPVVTERPGVVTFDGLGPYKYLLRVPAQEGERDRHREALRRLLDYDRHRRAELCRTLEEYLARRGNISATAQALYVHPNTLRQRLRRIEEITGLDVREGEWLMIEIALKLLRLEELVG